MAPKTRTKRAAASKSLAKEIKLTKQTTTKPNNGKIKKKKIKWYCLIEKKVNRVCKQMQK